MITRVSGVIRPEGLGDLRLPVPRRFGAPDSRATAPVRRADHPVMASLVRSPDRPRMLSAVCRWASRPGGARADGAGFEEPGQLGVLRGDEIAPQLPLG